MTASAEFWPYLDGLRKALRLKAVASLGDARYEMYRDGIHTGHLNALDRASPHCSMTAAEAEDWLRVGCEYIDKWRSPTTSEKQP